jgi:hypothetical protein
VTHRTEGLEEDDLVSLSQEAISSPGLIEILRPLANTAAPSQTISMTRGRLIEDYLTEADVLDRGVRYHRDWQGTGCDLLEYGSHGLRMVAHADEVSYVLGGNCRDGAWPLIPYCYHLADGPRSARVIRYQGNDRYEIVSHGLISGDPDALMYRSQEPIDLDPGDRAAFWAELDYDEPTGRITGSLDNAVGVTAVIKAAEVLSRAGTPFSVLLTDEEEGPTGDASQTLSRGAARAFAHLPEAPLTAVIDAHGLPGPVRDALEGHRRVWGASMTEYSSLTRGSVTPPHFYRWLWSFARTARAHGVVVRQNHGGYVPRSDDIVAMLHSPRVALIGYPADNRHFDHGLPEANVRDIQHLSRFLVLLAHRIAREGAAFWKSKL